MDAHHHRPHSDAASKSWRLRLSDFFVAQREKHPLSPFSVHRVSGVLVRKDCVTNTLTAWIKISIFLRKASVYRPESISDSSASWVAISKVTASHDIVYEPQRIVVFNWLRKHETKDLTGCIVLYSELRGPRGMNSQTFRSCSSQQDVWYRFYAAEGDNPRENC